MFMISDSPKDTVSIAREFAKNLEPHLGGATVVALSGELGSGKTTFTKSFAEAFGVKPEDITSPTFVIQKKFTIEGHGHWKTLVHMDAYRLEKPEEIEKLGWKELLADKSNLILIEWPENIGRALPKHAQRISFSYKGENSREIVFN
jgi:tRNA threonylcarbamoyladenosine biosynthesis protein TsaE